MYVYFSENVDFAEKSFEGRIQIAHYKVPFNGVKVKDRGHTFTYSAQFFAGSVSFRRLPVAKNNHMSDKELPNSVHFQIQNNGTLIEF